MRRFRNQSQSGGKYSSRITSVLCRVVSSYIIWSFCSLKGRVTTPDLLSSYPQHILLMSFSWMTSSFLSKGMSVWENRFSLLTQFLIISSWDLDKCNTLHLKGIKVANDGPVRFQWVLMSILGKIRPSPIYECKVEIKVKLRAQYKSCLKYSGAQS